MPSSFERAPWLLSLSLLAPIAACHLVSGIDEFEVKTGSAVATSVATGAGGAGGTGVSQGAGGAGGGSGGNGEPPKACKADGDCGATTECTVRTCAMGLCQVDHAALGTTCETSKECDGSGHCLTAIGSACQDAAECGSGFCEDLVCCDKSCGVCRSCASAGKQGTCDVLPPGSVDALGCGGSTLCDGLGQCATGEPAWSRALGGADLQEAVRVALDPSGNIIVAGHFVGSLTIGGASLSSLKDAFSKSTQDLFVAKLDSMGVPLWAVALGGTGFDEVDELVVDAKGDAILGGRFDTNFQSSGAAALLTATGTESDGFVAKLSGKDGAGLYNVRLGGAGRDQVTGLAVDGNGRVALAAMYDSADAVLTSVSGMTSKTFKAATKFDVALALLNPDGTAGWTFAAGAAASDVPLDVRFSSDDANLWFTGYTCPSPSGVDLGGGAVVSGGACAAFLARFVSDGMGGYKHAQSKGMPSTNDLSAGVRLRPLADGGALLAGSFKSSAVDLPGGLKLARASSGTSRDYFFARLDASLTMTTWAFNVPVNRAEAAVENLDVALDGAGNPVLFAEVAGPATTFLGTSIPAQSGKSALVLAKLTGDVVNKTPTPYYVRSWGGGADARARGLALSLDGRAAMVGSYSSGFDFDVALVNAGAQDAFVLRAAP